MFRLAIPILGVSDSVAAEAFYCQKLGFRPKYVYRPDPKKSDPCWMGVVRDGAHVVLSSFAGDGPAGSRNIQIFIDDAVAVHREYEDAGVESLGDLMDQSWGNLEFGVRDPDGNRINFAQSKSG
jgi:catechol 2,3-dioxygenase-like lactoylglutathione lyase family enzyme